MPDPRRDPVLQWNFGEQPREITVRWRYATTNVWVHWGDSTNRDSVILNERKHHIYDSVGAYMVHIREDGGAYRVLAEAQVVIRHEERPLVTVERDSDHPGYVIARAPEELDTTGILPLYRVHWNYQTQPLLYDDIWGLPSATVRRSMPPGEHTARVYDRGTKRWKEISYTIPERTLDFRLAVDGRAVTLTVEKAASGKNLIVAWGDGGLAQPVSNNTATHTYAESADLTYLVQLWYADGSGSTAKAATLQGEPQ